MITNDHNAYERVIYTKCESTSVQDNYLTICDWIVGGIASQNEHKQIANFVARFKFDEY